MADGDGRRLSDGPLEQPCTNLLEREQGVLADEAMSYFEGEDGENEVYIRNTTAFLAETVMPEDTNAICPWPVEDTGEERRLRALPLLDGKVSLRIWELPEFACGSRIWDSAIILTKYLEETLPSIREKASRGRLIELGTGTGLVGIACWYLGWDVTITDYDDSVMFLPRENAALNGATDGRLHLDTFLWGEDCSQLKPPYDVIVGSDLVYDPSCFTQLCQSLSDLSDDKTEIFFCNHRRRGEQKVFLKKMEAEFNVEIISDFQQMLPEAYHVENLFIYRFTKKPRLVSVFEE